MGSPGDASLTTGTRQQIPMRDCDAIVVGAGPAGLIAARELAARAVTRRRPRGARRIGAPGHCTGVLGLDAFDELNLSRRAMLGTAPPRGSSPPTAHCRDRRRARARRSRRSRAVRSASRRRRDAAGADAAQPGSRVGALDRASGGVTAHTSAGSVTARAAVLACGASYRFNRALGLGVPRLLAHSAQLEVPFPPLDDVQYTWAARSRRAVSRGSCRFRARARRTRAWACCASATRARRSSSFAATIRRTHGLMDEWAAPRLKVLPLAPVARTWTDRILAVGDAAGLVKPTTGGGIYYGLLSGHIAADVLSDALRDDQLTANRLQGIRAPLARAAGTGDPRRPQVPHRRVQAARYRRRSPDGARPRRRDRAAPQGDRELQLARHRRSRPPSPRRVPEDRPRGILGIERFRVQGSGFKVQGSGSGSGSGFRTN